MSGGEARADERCPECSAPLVRSEPRFSAWCRGCDWNVDPRERLQKRPGRVARLRQRIEDQLAESLFNDLAKRGDDGPRARLAEVAAFAIAIVIHLYTLGLLVFAGWLAYVGWRNPLAWVAVLILLGIVFLMRPRFGRLEEDEKIVSRKSAPTLHALVDRMRAEAGSAPIDLIAVDTHFNAMAGAIGLRRRRVLVIGLPLWNVLDRQERVAVLGHELGHLVLGDLRRGLVVGTALRAVAVLVELFQGDRDAVVDDGLHPIVRGLMWIVGLPARLVFTALFLLTLRAGQRSEYLADRLGSKLGGSDATASSFASMLTGPLLMNRLATEVLRSSRRDLWEVQREYFRDFPAQERERLLRAAAKERARADETHPPTHLRIKLAERPELRVPPAIVLDPAEAEAIERELKPYYDVLGRRLRDELLPVDLR